MMVSTLPAVPTEVRPQPGRRQGVRKFIDQEMERSSEEKQTVPRD